MPAFARKTAPRVVDGRVQKKNRHALTPASWAGAGALPEVVRERPGEAFRHVLTQRHIHQFLALLPDWPALSRGLERVLLARGERGVDGWHQRGTVALCAWGRGLWEEWDAGHLDEHRGVLDRLLVPYEEQGDGSWLCRFDEQQARGFQLMHVLLHELGHHHDRMTTRPQRRTARGEQYAERYAAERAERLWDRYLSLRDR